MSAFDDLVFDLDDTLLDTYGQLVPQAAREACAKMIEAGLDTTIESCLKARDEIVRRTDRPELFRELVKRFGLVEKSSALGENGDHVARAGFRAFYDRKVEMHLDFFQGAREMLGDLRKHYRLHLVTAGHPDTQSEKLSILRARDLFDSVSIVNTFKGESKLQAFESIFKQTGHEAKRHLSIGNRLDTDIAPAKRLGWTTCWIQYGEYAHTIAANAFEAPDFKIDSIQKLVSTCQL